MPRMRLMVILAAFVIASAPAAAEPPKKGEPPAAGQPWFVDDEEFFGDFVDALTDLAKDGKCLDHDKLVGKMKSGTRANITPARPGDKVLSPEEVYKAALPSVFVVGSVYKDKNGDWKDGTYATAWVAAADGVLVTNWHVFEDLEPGEVFGATDRQGNVYPVTDFLGGDKIADVAVFRIATKGLTPLPVAADFAPVGSWVGVLSHPGDNFYVFTQGHVSRYSTNKNDDGKRERWLGLTAEYAGGSSGGPVLNKHGAVVGMAALTLTLDGGDKQPKGMPMNPARRFRTRGQPPHVAPAPREKDAPPPREKDGRPAVQMVLKMAVPGPTILKLLGK